MLPPAARVTVAELLPIVRLTDEFRSSNHFVAKPSK